MPNPLVRQYTAELRHDGGSIPLTTSVILPNDRPAATAVRMILTAEGAPMGAVQRVYEWPTCDHCYRVATRYVPGPMILPGAWCEYCAEERGAVTEELDVTRLPEVPRDQWAD